MASRNLPNCAKSGLETCMYSQVSQHAREQKSAVNCRRRSGTRQCLHRGLGVNNRSSVENMGAPETLIADAVRP
jgi:hypothetical protein